MVKGGRYDNLLGCFGKKAPAIGFAVVIDDLLLALARQNVSFVKEDITYLTYNESDYGSRLAEAKELRRQGKRTALIPRQEDRHE